MNGLLQDLRYALRTCLQRPGFTAVAVLTLALGIGANSAIFSAVHGVLLAPLPYPEPDRLAMVWEDHRAGGGPEQEWTGQATYQDWRRGNRSFAALTAFTGWQPNLTGRGEPERLVGALVSSEYFTVLGIEPARGRGFLPAEGRPGAPRVTVLTDGFWRRRFAADPDLVGRPILLQGEPHTVVGILPPGVEHPFFAAELFRPLQIPDSPGDRGNYYLRVFGRLKPGVALAAARADLDRVTAAIAEESPEYYRGVSTNLVSLRRQVAGEARTPLLVLLGAVGLVLLIACANVANLLLARASTRGREIAVRTAMGAGRGRLVRQLLTESVLLALLGGALGILGGIWGADLLRTLAPPGTPRVEQIGVDGPVLVWSLLLALATGFAFGLAPALQASRPDLDSALKEGGRSAGAGAGSRRLRTALVVGEVALSLALLAGAGLLLKSFLGMLRTDLGFDPGGLLVADLVVPEADYREAERVASFYSSLTTRLEALPGVAAAGAVSVLPLSGGDNDVSFTVEGRTPPAKGQEPAFWYRSATPGYFRALGMTVLRGRSFDVRDGATAPPVALVNEAMARRFFAGEDPVGRRIRLGGADSGQPWKTIVGVVADVRHDGPAAPAKLEAFFPLAQQPERAMTLVVRAPDPLGVVPSVRAEVLALDRNLPLSAVGTMEQVLAGSVAAPRFTASLLAGFAAVALVLAAVGIYGVTAYAVAQRSHEIGVRVALGAGRRDVLRQVVGRGMAPALAGLALGLALAFALTRAMAGLLVGVSPTDPATFAGVALLLAGVALLANYLPARRAARLDPVRVLKRE